MKNNKAFICRHCGLVVDGDALSCPGCGSDNQTGWSDYYTADNAVEDESSSAAPVSSRPWFRYLVALVAAVLIAALLIVYMPLGSYLAVLWIAAVALYLWFSRPHSEKVKSAERRLEKELAGLVNGDWEKASRLINYEKKRNIKLSRLQCIDNAIYRLRRDRN